MQRNHVTPLLNDLHWPRIPGRRTHIQVVPLCVLVLFSWGGAALSARCHSACYGLSTVPECRRKVRLSHKSETQSLRLLDHMHGTVYLSSSLTARHLSSSRNIMYYLFSLSFRARKDCVKRPCSRLGRLRRYNFVTY